MNSDGPYHNEQVYTHCMATNEQDKKTGEGTLNGSLKMQRYVNVHDTLCADHCCSHRTEVELMIRLL